MRKVLAATAAVVCGVFITHISACGGGDGASAITGRAFKGPMNSAKVSIFRLDPSAQRGELLANYQADNRGFFLADKEFPFPVLLAASGGGFLFEATGETLPMTDGLELLAMAPALTLGQTIAVTPFTHMATFQVDERLAMGDTLAEAINAANRDVAQRFGVPEVDLILTIPMDLTDPDEAKDTGASITSRASNRNMSIKVDSQCSASCLYGLAIAALSIAINDVLVNDISLRANGANLQSAWVTAAEVWGALASAGNSIGSIVATAAAGNTPSPGQYSSIIAFFESVGRSIGVFLGGPLNHSGLRPGVVVISPQPGGAPTGTLPPSPTPPPPAPLPPAAAPAITAFDTCGGAATPLLGSRGRRHGLRGLLRDGAHPGPRWGYSPVRSRRLRHHHRPRHRNHILHPGHRRKLRRGKSPIAGDQRESGHRG